MRFSIWPKYDRPWDELVGLVRHCETSGWDGVYFADHFMPNTRDGSPADGAVHECWSVLAGLAVAVPRLRLGSLVAGNTYRHPAVLAKMAATIDHLSGGRVVLGLGAGWQENEHRAYGIALPPPGERLDRLEEACQVILGLLRHPRTTFAGRHYQLTDAPLDPKPVQARLPLLVGGSGEKRTMRIAATYADEWNTWSDPETMAHKLEVLRSHCDAVGRDPSEIVVSTQALIALDGMRLEPPPYGRFCLSGSAAELVDHLGRFAELGVAEFIVPEFNWAGSLAERIESADRFRTEVVGALEG